MTGYVQINDHLYPNSWLPDGKIVRQVTVSTYEVGHSVKGTGYVSCDDEWAPRLMHWHPYVITPAGKKVELPTSASKSFATFWVRQWLAGETT